MAGVDSSEQETQVQFCNSCDTKVIVFASQAFYTCDAICDVFICLQCAECSNGHELRVAKNVPPGIQESDLICGKCFNIIGFEQRTVGYLRCGACEV